MSLEDSINLRRAIVSATIGRIIDAEAFFEPVEQAMKGSPSLVFRMARLYQSTGAITQCVRAGRRILARLPKEAKGHLPLPARTLLFPKPWAEVVKAEAQKWNLDPSFTYAVIRQESVFDPEVVSPAGAIGLMQIMPATGKTIARELGEPFSIETLYTPEANIRYGTYYLHKLLKEFNNSHEFTLAGYNGGPPKAKEWQDRGKDKDPDLMVEGIVFSETRNYVKKVMANFWTYSQIMP
jgi:soluble lytic murein transglycosylase